MNLKIKWHLKEAGRALLAIPFSATVLVLVVITIRMRQFHVMGLEMYPELSYPKTFQLTWALDQFWSLSLAPLLPYFLVTLPFDVLVRRYVLHLNEK